MRLILSMLSCPDGARPDMRTIDRVTTIGRGRDSDWILPAPPNTLSRRHCVLTPVGDVWRLTDISGNGTFLNDAPTPLGPDQSCDLHDGDQIRLWDYVIEARYDMPASNKRRDQTTEPPWNERTDPMWSGYQATTDASDWTSDPPYRGGGRTDEADFAGQPMPDHASAIHNAWQKPVTRIEIPPDFGALDDAWLQDAQSKAKPDHSSQQVPDWTTEPEPVQPDDPTYAAPLSGKHGRGAVDPPPPVRTDPTERASTTGTGLLAAFLEGAGLADVAIADPEAVMRSVGRILRTAVDELRSVQAARGSIKREFRILATIVASRDNNPIKFSADTDAALRTLLTGRRPPENAMAEVLEEIRLHELAMVAAMRDAVRGLLAELDPAGIQPPGGGLNGLLASQRKAKAFELYEALYARVAADMEDNFDSVFGKAFARSYERVVQDQEGSQR